MKYPKLLFTTCLFFCSITASDAQGPRGIQPSESHAIKDVSDAQIALDGARIVFVVGETSADRTRSQTRLWIVPTNGGEPKRLTAGEFGEATPRWSPDGKWIAFYSDRDKQNGLWIVAAEGGEPRLVAHVLRTNFHLKGAGESFTWAPDSARLAFTSAPEIMAEAARNQSPGEAAKLAGVPEQVTRPMTREEIEKLPAEVREMLSRLQGQAAPAATQPTPTDSLSKQTDDPRVITRLQYKSRTSFSDDLQSDIFVAELKTNQLRQLTKGPFYEHSINWSPKGNEIAYVANLEPDPDKTNNTDLFTVNVENGAIRRLTQTKGCEWTPVFSPDGAAIAFTGTKREITTIDSVAEDTHLFVMPALGGAARDLTLTQDRRVGAIKWSPGGQIVLFTAADHGQTLLYQVTAQGAVSSLFDYPAQITSFSVAKNGPLAMTISDPTHPAEVYGTRASGRIESITKINQPWLGTVQVMMPREFTFQFEGSEVQGWLVPPVNLDESRKYPMILSIHGGPHGMHGYGFSAQTQALAAQGYAVLLVNPRGSSGYGQKFADGCVNDWGGGDYRDLMKGVDEALTRFKFLDKDRMGVTGGSYGGYMTNWVVTQTDRFKAAVTVASLSNLISFYSTSLYQDLIHAEFNGQPWDNFDILWDRSPLKHIKKAKTPLLLLHGEQDMDVHITQAEEMYTALRMRGVETVFVRYPREGHGFREPRHREDSLTRTILWFDRLLKQPPANGGQ